MEVSQGAETLSLMLPHTDVPLLLAAERVFFKEDLNFTFFVLI